MLLRTYTSISFFFFQAEDGIRDVAVTGVQTCALPIWTRATGQAHYHSRSRSALWRKGETSGHTQAVAEVRVDCDGDAVLYVVRQRGPACHTGAPTCFGAPAGGTLARLAGTVAERARTRPAGSYTAQLLEAGVAKIAQKVGERSEEHTSELQSRLHLVCRLLLEKKKKKTS